jgi:hypothetical protein
MNEGIVPLTVVDDEVGASYWSTTNGVFLPLFLGSGCVVYESAGLVLGSFMFSAVPGEGPTVDRGIIFSATSCVLITSAQSRPWKRSEKPCCRAPVRPTYREDYVWSAKAPISSSTS